MPLKWIIGGAVACVAVGAALLVSGSTADADPGRSAGFEGSNSRQPRRVPGQEPGIAVLELFTSEGCSSCPPADRLLARIGEQGEDLGVFPLAFHVDYWDRLGWPDRFASADYTGRQRDYGRAFRLRSIYTPQLVVNGQAEVVGSRPADVERALTEALETRPSATVRLTAKQEGSRVLVDFRVAGANGRDRLQLALVQRRATTDVERGENAGRTLQHAYVVRDLVTAPIGGSGGSAVLEMPSEPGPWSVVGFVQQADSLRIVGAERADVG